MSLGDDRAPQQLIFHRRRPVPGGGVPGGDLAGLLALAVEGRLVHPQTARQQNAVGGNPLPGLEQYQIAHHHVGNRQEPDALGPFDAADGSVGLLLQTGEGPFAAAFGHGGDKRGQEHRHGDAHRFGPGAFPQRNQQIQPQGHQQNTDDGIGKTLKKPGEKRLAVLPRKGVGAVPPPGGLHLCAAQSRPRTHFHRQYLPERCLQQPMRTVGQVCRRDCAGTVHIVSYTILSAAAAYGFCTLEL